MKESDFNKIFGSIGFGFPQSIDELNEFNKTFENYKFEGNKNKINPKNILANLKKTNPKITKNDYHKRTVLAAEIVSKLHNERTLGHLKLQKLMYLCQNSISMDLHTNFLKQAMGPYDPKLMRSIDKQLKDNKWFFYQTKEFPKYKIMERAGGHKQWFEIYFREQLFDIDYLIEKFRYATTNQIEIVATIFACWKEIKDNKEIFSNELIIKKFYAWHKDKEKYERSRIINAIDWMTKENIYPI